MIKATIGPDSRVLDHDQVAQALEALEKELVEATTKPTAMETALHALGAAYEFVQSLEFLRQRDLGAPFFWLQLALQDLQQGKVASFLNPAQRSKSLPTSTLQMRGIAIFCDDILRKLGASPAESLQFVAKQLRANGFDFGQSTKSDEKVIAYWRSEVSRDADNSTAVFVKYARENTALPENATLAEGKFFVAAAIQNTMKGIGRFGS